MEVTGNFTVKHKLLWLGLAVLVITTGLVWLAISIETPKDVLRVSFLDVGQGDAIFIETPAGNQVLVDGGANKKVLRQLSQEMPFYDRFIDVLIATHPDLDHIGGLVPVIKRYNVGLLVKSPVRSDGAAEKSFEFVSEGVPQAYGLRGGKFILDNGVYLEIFSPTAEMIALEPNDASIIAKLTYGQTGFLLTGDASKSIEEFVIGMGDDIDVDVLKLGHHGSKTSTGVNLLGFSSPEFAVVSAGQDNSYGHPHSEVLEMLEKFDIEVLQTAEEGIISFESDGWEVTRVE